mmetsp:Transcript_54617/g.132647  ORF Transcript_54617/g.132647 Transcript_54617/m.132647 type:complete len:410 (+) Transcript_54617:38-1267(+)
MATTRTHDFTTMTMMRVRIALVAVTAVYLSAAAVMVASAFTPPFGSGSSSSVSLPSSRSVSTSSRIICHSHKTPPQTATTTKTTTIRVCQNKHCRKRAQQKDILQTVHNLLDLPPSTSSTSSSSSTCGVVDIVSSGCLSECDKGPNLEVEVEVSETHGDSTNKILLLHGMKDTQSCITQFNLLSASRATPGTADDISDDSNSRSNNSICFDSLKPNKVLIAASKVIEQTNTLKKNDEKIRYLSSIIDTLDTKTSIQIQNANGNANNRDVDVASRSSYIDYSLSAVYAHAHASRAQTYLEMDRYDDAIQDAQRVVSTQCSSAATPLSITLAYRSWVDAEYMKLLSEEQQQEQPPSGLSTMTMMMAVGQRRPLLLRPNTDTSKIRSVLQQWLIDQPTYRLKIEEELKNLPS